MRESNERSRDLQSKVHLEKESKNYKYAQSEREAGIPPRNKHEATFCYTKEITAAAIFDRKYLPQIFKQEDFNNHLIEEVHAFCGIEDLSTASTLSSNNSVLNSTIESTAFKETNLNIHFIE